MERFGFSPYEYLTFLVPGGVLGFAAIFGWGGWPYGEPGAGLIIAAASGAFVLGHFVSAFSNFLEPLWWGHRPGQRVSSTEGLFGKRGLFSEEEEKNLGALLEELFPQLSTLQARFRAAYIRSLRRPAGPQLAILVQQIGFYRSMAAVSLLSVGIVAGFALVGKSHLPWLLWCPVFALGAITFAARYRRFWARVGEYVMNSVLEQES